MDIDTILISVLSSLGISGIVGIYLQYLWTQRGKTESLIQAENRKTYESTIVWMRIFLNPEKVKHYNVCKIDPTLLGLTEKELKEHARNLLVSFYIESVLFYPDCVLMAIKDFLNNPREENLMKTAVAMKKDLWKKNTKIDLKTLSL